jgi:hypothetical protein
MTKKELDDQLYVVNEQLRVLKEQLNKTNSNLVEYEKNDYKIAYDNYENKYDKKVNEDLYKQYKNVKEMVEHDDNYFSKKWYSKKKSIGPPNPRPFPKKPWPEEETPVGTIGRIRFSEPKDVIILDVAGEEIVLGKLGDFEEIAKNLSAHIAKKMLEGVK